MPIITFWSNNEKAIGQTVSASLAATVMAMKHNYKVLLISADYNNTTIEDCFGGQESNNDIIKTLIKKPQMNLDSGINGLLKLADNNRITPEIIKDYTKIIFKNRLEVLYSPVNILEDKNNDVMEKFKNIILNASRYYDYIIVDLKKGLKCQQQLEILMSSDVIVINIDQGTKTIEKFFEIKEMVSLTNKLIWNICRYDDKSKYNTKNLTRTILRKSSIYETHYNTLVLEAAQEGKIVELLIRLKTLKEEDNNSVLIRNIEELVQGISSKYQEIRSRM